MRHCKFKLELGTKKTAPSGAAFG